MMEFREIVLIDLVEIIQQKIIVIKKALAGMSKNTCMFTNCRPTGDDLKSNKYQ